MTLESKHHAKKKPQAKPKKTLAEKRRRSMQSEASAARANRDRSGPRKKR